MSEKIRVLLSEDEVEARIRQIAAKISKDYAGKEIHLICVLKGGVFFTCELAKRITVPVSLDFMSVSSYGAVSYTHLDVYKRQVHTQEIRMRLWLQWRCARLPLTIRLREKLSGMQ